MTCLRLGGRLALFACALAVASATARAQDPQPTPQAPETGEEQPVSERDDEARGLFLAGSAAFDRGDFDVALDYFQRAYELSQRPGLLFNIGHTAERLRRDELALESFERYLRDKPDADNRDAVESRIALLREAIAERDEQTTETTPPPTPTQPPADEGGPGAAPIVVMGAGGAAAITGVVLLVLASSSASEVEDAPDGTPWTDVSSDYDSAGTLGVAGGITLGIGAAAVAAGLGWLIAGGSGGGSAEADVAVRLGPAGVDLRGTF